jgi:hypothetical protein
MNIKYWDKKEKKWLDPYWVCLWQGRPQLLEAGPTSINSFDSTYNPIQFEEDNLGGAYYDENIIAIAPMGIKDANGSEIYKGDVLKAKRTISGLPTKDGKAAEYFSGDYSDSVTRTWDEFVLAEFKETKTGLSFTLPQEMTYQERGKILKWEICGNVYEHPELMTGRHEA